METKTSKVKKAMPYGEKSQYGDYTYIIDFENGEGGFYKTKTENQGQFVVGKEAEYTIEVKTSKAGKDYNIVRPASEKAPAARGGFGAGNAAGVEVQKERLSFDKSKEVVIVRQTSLKASMEYHSHVGTYTLDQILDTAEFLTNWVMSGERKTSTNERLHHENKASSIAQFRETGVTDLPF